MDKEQVKALLLKYEAGECTKEEKALLEHWFYTERTNKVPEAEEIENDLNEVWQRLQYTPVIRKLWPRIAVAASILFSISIGGYLFYQHATPVKQFVSIKQDIPPGRNRATLVLANGQKVILTKGLSGQLAVQGQTNIIASNNAVVYSTNSARAKVNYNTMVTARGEQSPYPLILSDGTKVWLNAESEITFPTTFPDRERIVKVTGEAYFEVAKDRRHPFIVETDKQHIKVLGTHFNINSYSDEPATYTTLIEGSVQVLINGTHQVALLKPGEQSALKNDHINIAPVDVESVTAWKNNKFVIESEDIQSIMRKIARWYDVDVSYDGPLPQTNFNGSGSRSSSVSHILEVLELTDKVHFKIEGRRISVRR